MSLRIALLGTGPFAVPAFAALVAAGHHPLCVITRPDKPSRGRLPPPSPTRVWAERNSLPVFAPDSINSPAAHQLLGSFEPDLLMVCDYGQILSRVTLGLARYGGINLHGSLLPRHRGAAPIQWAIYHGDATTGVTVIHMTPQLDAGPTLTTRVTPIGPNETNVELEPRLAQLGADAVVEAVALLERGAAAGTPQDNSLATPAPRLKKSDGEINWRQSAAQLRRQILAWQPWPKSFTAWRRDGGEELRLIIEAAHVIPESELNAAMRAAEPGEIVRADDQLWLRCGEGALAIEQLQPAGKKLQPVAEFLRGYKPRIGVRWMPATVSPG